MPKAKRQRTLQGTKTETSKSTLQVIAITVYQGQVKTAKRKANVQLKSKW